MSQSDKWKTTGSPIFEAENIKLVKEKLGFFDNNSLDSDSVITNNAGEDSHSQKPPRKTIQCQSQMVVRANNDLKSKT